MVEGRFIEIHTGQSLPEHIFLFVLLLYDTAFGWYLWLSWDANMDAANHAQAEGGEEDKEFPVGKSIIIVGVIVAGIF